MWSYDQSIINKQAKRKVHIQDIKRIFSYDSAIAIQSGSESLPNFQGDPIKFLDFHMEKGKNLKDTIKLEEMEFTIFEILLYSITNLNASKIIGHIVPLILKHDHFFGDISFDPNNITTVDYYTLQIMSFVLEKQPTYDIKTSGNNNFLHLLLRSIASNDDKFNVFDEYNFIQEALSRLTSPQFYEVAVNERNVEGKRPLDYLFDPKTLDVFKNESSYSGYLMLRCLATFSEFVDIFTPYMKNYSQMDLEVYIENYRTHVIYPASAKMDHFQLAEVDSLFCQRLQKPIMNSLSCLISCKKGLLSKIGATKVGPSQMISECVGFLATSPDFPVVALDPKKLIKTEKPRRHYNEDLNFLN
jgi:hypothetical protein